MTLRLTDEGIAFLAEAHAAVGDAIPLHRLAALALARGAREIAANPAVLFAAPAPRPSAAVAEPAAPIVEAVGPRNGIGRVSDTVSKPSRKPPPAAAGARARWGEGVPEADAAKLELELAAVLDGPDAMSGRAFEKVTKVTARIITDWRKARRAGERAVMSAPTYKKLRTYFDKTSKGGKGR